VVGVWDSISCELLHLVAQTFKKVGGGRENTSCYGLRNKPLCAGGPEIGGHERKNKVIPSSRHRQDLTNPIRGGGRVSVGVISRERKETHSHTKIDAEYGAADPGFETLEKIEKKGCKHKKVGKLKDAKY